MTISLKAKATITFDVVTEDSASEGCTAANGWWMPGCWEYPLEDEEGRHDDVLEQAKAGDFDLGIKEAIKEAKSLGICEQSNDSSWHSVDPDHGDFSTDEIRHYSLHIEGATPSSLKRIARIMKGK